jgi:hypothetical protein
VAAANLSALLPRQSDELRSQSEEDLVLIFAILLKQMKLTPRLARVLIQLAEEHDHKMLKGLLRGIDVSAGLFVVGHTVCGKGF